MANIRRSRRNLAGEQDHKSALSGVFTSNWLIEKYQKAIEIAEKKEDVREMRAIIRDISDRIYGRPAQVMINEQTGVQDVLESFHAQMIEAGLGSIIVLDNPNPPALESKDNGEATGDYELPVSADLLGSEQLHTVEGAEGVSRIEVVDTPHGGGSERGEVLLDSKGVR